MDETVLLALNVLAGTPLRPILALLGEPWTAGVLVVGLVVLAAARRDPRLLVLWGAAAILSNTLAAEVIKDVVDRPRPCAVMTLDLLAPCGAGAAMPSAHAANTAALAVVGASPVLGVVAAVVGISRVVAGQHWPSDVVAGWILGALVGALVRAGAQRFLGWT